MSSQSTRVPESIPAPEDAGKHRVDLANTDVDLASSAPTELAVNPTGFLLAVAGAAHGRLFRLDQNPTVLGCAPDTHVHLGDDGVTQHHAQIRHEPPHHILEVLDGRGATFVNGTPVERRALVPGDRLQFGEHARMKYLSRLGDGLEHRISPLNDPTSGPLGTPTRSGIKVRPGAED
jgi:pSer/pThr/pTyr-binding forkhead associated (FHA) protein